MIRNCSTSRENPTTIRDWSTRGFGYGQHWSMPSSCSAPTSRFSPHNLTKSCRKTRLKPEWHSQISWISEDRYSARFSHILDFLDWQIGILISTCLPTAVVDRYSFNVMDFHHLLLAGLPAHPHEIFNLQPHLISRPGLRILRAEAHEAWANATAAA